MLRQLAIESRSSIAVVAVVVHSFSDFFQHTSQAQAKEMRRRASHNKCVTQRRTVVVGCEIISLFGTFNQLQYCVLFVASLARLVVVVLLFVASWRQHEHILCVSFPMLIVVAVVMRKNFKSFSCMCIMCIIFFYCFFALLHETMKLPTKVQALRHLHQPSPCRKKKSFKRRRIESCNYKLNDDSFFKVYACMYIFFMLTCALDKPPDERVERSRIKGIETTHSDTFEHSSWNWQAQRCDVAQKAGSE